MEKNLVCHTILVSSFLADELIVDSSHTQRFFANILNEGSPRQRPVSLESSLVPSIRTSSTTPMIPSSEDALPQDKPLPDRPPSTASKKSKLASLVNSRLSIAVSSLPGSSRDDGTSLLRRFLPFDLPHSLILHQVLQSILFLLLHQETHPPKCLKSLLKCREQSKLLFSWRPWTKMPHHPKNPN